MNRIKPDVDIVMDILEAVIAAKPANVFTQSLLFQYKERGGLSKKQLEGLYLKAAGIDTIPAGKLATLQAIILKKPTRFKSPKPEPTPLYKKDEKTGQLIQDILNAFPMHKRVIFFQSKYNNNEVFTSAELAELQKFSKLLLKK